MQTKYPVVVVKVKFRNTRDAIVGFLLEEKKDGIYICMGQDIRWSPTFVSKAGITEMEYLKGGPENDQ